MNGNVQTFAPASDSFVTTSPMGLSGNPFLNLGVDVRTAVGDINGDGVPDYILATGPGTEFRVAVVSGVNGSILVPPFDPFPPAPGEAPFTGGAFVSAGSFLGNGRDQFAVSPDQSGGPRIAIYDLDGASADGTEIHPGNGLTRINNFFSVDANFRGGARTAIGDLNNDGVPDLAIAAGYGGGPAALVINGTRVPTTDGFTQADDLVQNFFAFDSNLRDGAYVAIGDALGDGQQDLILGSGTGGPSEVEILSGSVLSTEGSIAAMANPVSIFTPTGLGVQGAGLRVGASENLDGSSFVVVGSGDNLPGVVKVYSSANIASGSTKEPANGQILTPFVDFSYSGLNLADGVFVS